MCTGPWGGIVDVEVSGEFFGDDGDAVAALSEADGAAEADDSCASWVLVR